MSRQGALQGSLGLPRVRLSLVNVSLIGVPALLVASWVFVLVGDGGRGTSFFSVATFTHAWGFVKDLAGAGSAATPSFADWDQWRETGSLAYKTLAMSVLGIGIAGTIALATFMFGASNIMQGELAPYGSWLWRTAFFVTRAFFVLMRGVPELVWAMMIVFVFSPGMLPGALALGLHNGGILGKLGSEVVEGLDPRPMRALRSTGASRLQVLAYGVLPQALPRFLTYLFYRWEVIIRTTIVVGFVAAGGLGLDFRLSMSHFHYTRVALLMIWYLLLVLAVDVAAALFRRMAR